MAARQIYSLISRSIKILILFKIFQTEKLTSNGNKCVCICIYIYIYVYIYIYIYISQLYEAKRTVVLFITCINI